VAFGNHLDEVIALALDWHRRRFSLVVILDPPRASVEGQILSFRDIERSACRHQVDAGMCA
jgi:hypothetical protein